MTCSPLQSIRHQPDGLARAKLTTLMLEAQIALEVDTVAPADLLTPADQHGRAIETIGRQHHGGIR
ncbi:MAG: hypothetical protein ACR2RF_27885 [Geminicoccaceae bacterium]